MALTKKGILVLIGVALTHLGGFLWRLEWHSKKGFFLCRFLFVCADLEMATAPLAVVLMPTRALKTVEGACSDRMPHGHD